MSRHTKEKPETQNGADRSLKPNVGSEASGGYGCQDEEVQDQRVGQSVSAYIYQGTTKKLLKKKG